MEIMLPYRLDRHQINNLMSEVINKNKQPVSNELNFNFSSLGFIEPAGITSLGNLFEWLVKKGADTKITLPEKIGVKKWCPIEYLDDSDFFLKYIGKKINETSTVRPTTIPLQNVTYESSYQWLESTFVNWIANRIGVQNATLGNIEMCLGEIFNNIRDHSTENIGCIYAQHYPNKNKLVFTIADFGVGIPDNIRKLNRELNDSEALNQAIREGVTSKTSPRNLGAGLHTLIKNIVDGTKGSVHIHSGYGILNASGGKDGIEVDSHLTQGYYPGTFLEVVIDTDVIIEEDKIESQEEFVW